MRSGEREIRNRKNLKESDRQLKEEKSRFFKSWTLLCFAIGQGFLKWNLQLEIDPQMSIKKVSFSSFVHFFDFSGKIVGKKTLQSHLRN